MALPSSSADRQAQDIRFLGGLWPLHALRLLKPRQILLPGGISTLPSAWLIFAGRMSSGVFKAFNGMEDGWSTVHRPEELEMAWSIGTEMCCEGYCPRVREAMESLFMEQEDADGHYRRQEQKLFLLRLTMLKRSLPRSRASNSSDTVAPETQPSRWFVKVPLVAKGGCPDRPEVSQDTGSVNMVAEWR